MSPSLLSRSEMSSEANSNRVLHSVERGRQRSFRHREFLPVHAHQLWAIDAGYIRALTWDTTGAITTLGIWGPRDVVGHRLSKLEPYKIECLTSVQVRELPFSSCFLQEAMVAYVQQTEILLSFAYIKHTSTRLLKLLHWLAQRFGKITEQGCVIDLWLTHQLLSEMIGSTRVTVTRTLKELEQEGKLKQLRRHHIFLPGFSQPPV